MSILNLCATAPTFSVKCWEGVQSMDAGALISVHITKAMDVGEYDKNMLSEIEQAYQIAHNPDCYSSVPVAAVLLEDDKQRTSLHFTATQMGEFIMPSQH